MLKNQILQMFLFHKKKIIYSHKPTKDLTKLNEDTCCHCHLQLPEDALLDKSVVAKASTALSKQKGHLVLRQKTLHTQITLYFEELRYIQI